MRHYEDIEAIYERPASIEPAKPRQGLGSSEGGPLVMGIDPGPTHSAYALIDADYTVLAAAKAANADVIAFVSTIVTSAVVVESLQSYGMPVGRSVFETAYQIGRILGEAERQGLPVTLYPRQEYARAICGTAKVSDSILKQSLELRFGGYRKGEPLALLRGNSDKRSAYGLAVYWLDLHKRDGRRG